MAGKTGCDQHCFKHTQVINYSIKSNNGPCYTPLIGELGKSGEVKINSGFKGSMSKTVGGNSVCPVSIV